jgi:transposase
MKQWCEIRMRVLRGEASIRQIQRETGLHYETVKKMLLHPSPPEFRCPDRSRPKLGPYLAFIADTISADKEMPKKQRHTAKRIFELIREQGYEGGYTQVKEAVRELKRTSQEKFVPLAHAPGEAQMDFGMAVVNMNGKLRKVMFFAMVLSHSGAMYVRAYPRECTETFQDGHVQAFRYYGGVPTRISYDNAKTSVSKIIGVHARKLADGFLQLQSHYLFEEHFCRVRQPNEKGIVEGVVKFARLNFLVSVPQVRDFDELNVHLEQCCQDNLEWRVRGRSAPKKELLKEDQTAMLPLPEAPFDACRKASTATTTPCRCAMRTIPSWPRATWTTSASASKIALSPSTRGCGIEKLSPSSRSTTLNCWNVSQAHSITHGPCPNGNCPKVSSTCARAWKKTPNPQGHASSFACCNSWRSTAPRKCRRPSTKHFDCRDATAMSSPSTSMPTNPSRRPRSGSKDANTFRAWSSNRPT